MNKIERKEALAKLVNEFLTTNSLEGLIKSRQEIIEVFSAGTFADQKKKEIADTALLLVGNELSKFIIEANNKRATAQLKLEVNSSCVLLLTIFDVMAI
ncbi:MAG: hypothetical protein JST86_00965 [Bacteroidetes bacterium]|nr:hypothetical protein [Bacteroidota bacterium]